LLQPLYHLADRIRQRARHKTWNVDHATGRDGEDIAHRFLQQNGITVIARNWTVRGNWAEVDLIGDDEGVLVFVEVKTRTDTEFAEPDRAIDHNKRSKITLAAREYTRRSRRKPGLLRFDVVTVVLQPELVIRHEKDAFAFTGSTPAL